MVNIGVLASGGGSNLQAIIDACEGGILKGSARVAVVVSNKTGAFALERAKKHGIPALAVNPKDFTDNTLFCSRITQELKAHHADLVCLAGYMRMIDPCLLKEFKGKVINIHPALLPRFGGKGMYGRHVHEAVLAAGETVSGATVHWVDDEYDHGAVILQESVPVTPGDTCETLAKRVLEAEHRIYPKAIMAVIRGKD